MVKDNNGILYIMTTLPDGTIRYQKIPGQK